MMCAVMQSLLLSIRRERRRRSESGRGGVARGSSFRKGRTVPNGDIWGRGTFDDMSLKVGVRIRANPLDNAPVSGSAVGVAGAAAATGGEQERRADRQRQRAGRGAGAGTGGERAGRRRGGGRG